MYGVQARYAGGGGSEFGLRSWHDGSTKIQDSNMNSGEEIRFHEI
jgi:hypothetical protein